MPRQRQKKKRTNQRLHPQQSQKQNRKRVQRSVKDRLFRYLFEKDREALLDLYNALNGTAYEDASQLEIVTIESAVYEDTDRAGQDISQIVFHHCGVWAGGEVKADRGKHENISYHRSYRLYWGRSG